MNDEKLEIGRVEKICLDNDCQEKLTMLSDDCKKAMTDFIYCPFCSEELNLQCSVCHESVLSKDYKFCPWCGSKFEG